MDSHGSTTGSMNTNWDDFINQENVINIIEQKSNETSDQNQEFEEEEHYDHNQHSVEHLQEVLDSQNHIYSNPVYEEKTSPLMLTTAAKELVNSNVHNDQTLSNKQLDIVSREILQDKPLDINNATNTIDSLLKKKQRITPEFKKYKPGSGDISNTASSTLTTKFWRKCPQCCTAFPLQIILAILQLILSVSLVTLGSLMIVRVSALAMTSCGIWSGVIAGITGSLGVLSLHKTKTAFLALSLVCIATSTLALAISSVGLSRKLNQPKKQFNEEIAHSEISVVCGLIFALFLHFIVSVVSVFRSSLQVCKK